MPAKEGITKRAAQMFVHRREADPSLRLKDKVGAELNKMYDTEKGRDSLIELLQKHGNVQNVDAHFKRTQQTEIRGCYDLVCCVGTVLCGWCPIHNKAFFFFLGP